MAKAAAAKDIAPISLRATIAIKDLADKLKTPPTKIIEILMKHGVLATLNETIDFKAAAIVAKELGIAVTLESEDDALQETKAKSDKTGVPRPPVIAFMGHVDHGKTSLLDKIRSSDVVEKEAGGITQHLTAYQITYSNRVLTLIDTPGHEAFAALRQHGARLIDVAVIVVAADDGVRPQTEEAIKYVQKAGVKAVVAINKVDKPGTDLAKVRKQLADVGLNPEEWGGETVVVEVSAKTGAGIDKLLNMLLLVSDIEELKARTSGKANGTIMESHMEKGHGPVATVLVEEGELKTGDFLVAGGVYGKARTIRNSENKILSSATPSMPVAVAGWKELPKLGERFSVVETEREARAQSAATARNTGPTAPLKTLEGKEALNEAMADTKIKLLPVVIKADTQGSLDVILDSLKTLGNDEVKVKVIYSGIGPINESDISLIDSNQGQIIGFNVNLPSLVKQLADRSKIKIQLYRVIYELLEDLQAQLESLLPLQIIENTLGQLEVKGIFKVTKNALICGGKVTAGKITPGLMVRLKTKDVETASIGKVVNVQKEQNDVKQVVEGEICGLNIATERKAPIKLDDKLEFIEITQQTRKL